MPPSTITTTTTTTTTKNLKDPRFYRFEEPDQERHRHPPQSVDYRPENGPWLSYIWCSRGGEGDDDDDNNNSKSDPTTQQQQQQQQQQVRGCLTGQELYLGAEIGCDGKMYYIPGHALRVLQVDPETDQAIMIGPVFEGKYKWLRGVLCGDCIYGLPCHADSVLKIHVPTLEITLLPIDYEGFFPAADLQQQRQQEWKYHGGSISPIDGCIYAIPQSASHVLRVDPRTDKCTLTGPAMPGRYKWYGGIVGKQDKAIYGIPHNSAHVLRIHPNDGGITLHGDFGTGGHKWHGAGAAADGTIVSVPANADTVLCITPQADSSEPILTQVGDSSVLKSGRHRRDRKYKYLGAMSGPDGRVYCFPCASEHVLQVDTTTMTAREIGPNIYDHNMERLCQNKWQNGVHVVSQKCILGIPLAGESVLRIDFSACQRENDDPQVTTWPIPAPHKCMSKWEGAVVAPNNVVYTVPNNHKAVLRIELPGIAETKKEETLP